eukprot:6534-Heterococcus_DN1.PRE.3
MSATLKLSATVVTLCSALRSAVLHNSALQASMLQAYARAALQGLCQHTSTRQNKAQWHDSQCYTLLTV